MSITSLHKELKKITEQQGEISQDVKRLLSSVSKETDFPYGNWPLRTSAIKRIGKARREIKAGKGVKFTTPKEMQNYLRSMRYGK
ncbi:MAG: hypothetical protein G01um101433_127 [Parcubacteria group bacterium Gr01-1014_33]|nr:MAG: hypothetical protein G01um101433_127 [Parcubacteria group bacterium Gr01-1014_33]